MSVIIISAAVVLGMISHKKVTNTQLATVHFMLSDGAKYSGIHFWKA